MKVKVGSISVKGLFWFGFEPPDNRANPATFGGQYTHHRCFARPTRNRKCTDGCSECHAGKSVSKKAVPAEKKTQNHQKSGNDTETKPFLCVFWDYLVLVASGDRRLGLRPYRELGEASRKISCPWVGMVTRGHQQKERRRP